jgi:hypothetical protein
MSLPGEKALPPAPRSTTQRTASSAASSVTASPRRRHMFLVMALSFSGRFNATVAMAPSRSIAMHSDMAAPLSPFRYCRSP